MRAKHYWMSEAIKNTLVQGLGKVIGVGMGIVTTKVLTGRLGVGQYGVFIYLSSVLLLLDALADMGSRLVGVREIIKGNESQRADVFTFRLVSTGVAYILGLLVIVVYTPLRAYWLEGLLAFAMVWGTMMAGNWEMVVQIKNRLEWKVLGELLFSGCFLVGLLVLKVNSLALVFVIYLVARIVSLGIPMVVKLPWAKEICFASSWQRLQTVFGKVWPMGIYLLVFTSYDKGIDSLMIRHFLDEQSVGWYGLAYKIYGNLVLGGYFFVNSMFPILIKKPSKGIVRVSLGVLIVASCTILGLTYWSAPWIVGWIGGAGFEPTVSVLRLLGLGLVFSYVNHLLGFRLIAKGGQKKLLTFGLVAIVVNVGLNSWAIPTWGIVGAAVVTVVTEGVMTLCYCVKR